jgi:electron transfer flavoprotein beta subunit
MTPRGIFDAWQRKVPVWGRGDLTIDDSNIGLNGSPTRVKKSFTKAVKGKGTVVTLDPEESVSWLVDRLSEKFVI